jgi:hypothetical protein
MRNAMLPSRRQLRGRGCEDEARQARAEKQQYRPDSLSGGEPRISSEIRHWQCHRD